MGSFKAIMESFYKIQPRDLNKIRSYNRILLDSFEYLTKKDDFFTGIKYSKSSDNQQEIGKRLGNLDLLEHDDINI